jgi:hypothetical protein
MSSLQIERIIIRRKKSTYAVRGAETESGMILYYFVLIRIKPIPNIIGGMSWERKCVDLSIFIQRLNPDLVGRCHCSSRNSGAGAELMPQEGQRGENDPEIIYTIDENRKKTCDYSKAQC